MSGAPAVADVGALSSWWFGHAFSADVDAGTFTDVTFQEWDTANDVPVTGGGCLHLSSQVLSGTW